MRFYLSFLFIELVSNKSDSSLEELIERKSNNKTSYGTPKSYFSVALQKSIKYIAEWTRKSLKGLKGKEGRMFSKTEQEEISDDYRFIFLTYFITCMGVFKDTVREIVY